MWRIDAVHEGPANKRSWSFSDLCFFFWSFSEKIFGRVIIQDELNGTSDVFGGAPSEEH